jgi:hypothetical protein
MRKERKKKFDVKKAMAEIRKVHGASLIKLANE